MALAPRLPVIEDDDSTRSHKVLSSPRADSPNVDELASWPGIEKDLDLLETSPRGAPELDVSQQKHESPQSKGMSSTPGQGNRLQDRDMTTTDVEGASTASSAVIAKRPSRSLSSDQKAYLINQFRSTLKVDFAKPFLSLVYAESHNDSQQPESANLVTVLNNLSEDRYVSASAFSKDVKMIVQRSVTESSFKNGTNYHGKQLLDHVNRFTKNLPKPPSADDVVASSRMGEKRKAHDGADEQVSVKKTKLVGPSPQQQKEMAYAKKQVTAYRGGKQSNERKTWDNLVQKAIKRSEERDLQKRTDLLQEKRRLDLMARLGSGMVGNRDSGAIEDDDNNQDPQIAPKEEADIDSMSENSHIPGDEGDADDKQQLVVDQQNSHDTDDSQTQSIPRSIMVIKLKSSYKEHLLKLSTHLPSEEQVARLDYAATTGPNFLGRTAATERGWKFDKWNKKTNGYTSPDVLLPAADSRNKKQCSHAQLTDMTEGELVYMIGNHLIWKDLVADELLSYSKDPLFLVAHALRRHHEKQQEVTIQFLDRREARDKDGHPARFYSALDLYTIFKVPKWSGWGHANDISLHPRKFTQEYLSHGPVLTCGTSFQQARIEDLIKDGLYEIFPEFATPEDEKRAGLYTLQVVYRKIGYPPALNAGRTRAPNQQTTSDSSEDDEAMVQHGSQKPNTGASPSQSFRVHRTSSAARRQLPIYSYETCRLQVPMTVELLKTVRKVTLNFVQRSEESEGTDLEPPLHAFICFLTFEKRQKKDPVFMNWIHKHYRAQDVEDLYTGPQGEPLPGMTVVADNLPGYMQYLDLIRDCIRVFSLEPLPPNEVETKHVFGRLWGRSYSYAAYDDIQHREHRKSEKYFPARPKYPLKSTEKSKRHSKEAKNINRPKGNVDASKAPVAPPDAQLEVSGQRQ